MLGEKLPTDEAKMNSQYEKLTRDAAKSAAASGEPVGDNPVIKRSTKTSSGTTTPWTQLLESMDEISSAIENSADDSMNTQLDAGPEPVQTGGDDELLAQLDRIFTPVLVMQGFEADASDKIKEAMSEAVELISEKSLIQFDDDARMAQLISVCARLIAKQKNSEKYQMYVKAHKIKKQMLLEIQKDEYDAAKALAQKYLVKVSTTNNSPVARNAANDLLPATNH